MKTITQKKIKAMEPCSEGWRWYLEHKSAKIETLINTLISDNHDDWANWLIVRCMTHEQKIQYAIFAAEQVIDIYEKKYPDDARPQKAIEAAKAYLKKQSKENRDAADAAAYAAAHAAAYAAYAANAANAAANAAAHAAAYAAYAAYDAADAAANAAAYAANAAYAAYDAANAAAYAANAAYAAYDAANAAMKKKIVLYGLKLVEGSKP